MAEGEFKGFQAFEPHPESYFRVGNLDTIILPGNPVAQASRDAARMIISTLLLHGSHAWPKRPLTSRRT
jgi:hypothetical protein